MVTFNASWVKVADYSIEKGLLYLELLDERQHPKLGLDGLIPYPACLEPFCLEKSRVYELPEIKYYPISSTTYKTIPYHVTEGGNSFFYVKGKNFNEIGAVYKVPISVVRKYYERYERNYTELVDKVKIHDFEQYIGEVVLTLKTHSVNWLTYLEPVHQVYLEEDMKQLMGRVVLETYHFKMSLDSTFEVESEQDISDLPFQEELSNFSSINYSMVEVDGMYLIYKSKYLKKI